MTSLNIQRKILLQSRINLVNNSPTRKITPIPTSLCHDTWNIHILDIIWPLENTNVKAGGDVPGNVTVERPVQMNY